MINHLNFTTGLAILIVFIIGSILFIKDTKLRNIVSCGTLTLGAIILYPSLDNYYGLAKPLLNPTEEMNIVAHQINNTDEVVYLWELKGGKMLSHVTPLTQQMKKALRGKKAGEPFTLKMVEYKNKNKDQVFKKRESRSDELEPLIMDRTQLLEK